jgi:nicotinamidase-related amidase
MTRHDVLLHRDRSVVVIVDLQERLSQEVAHRDRTVSAASKLVAGARILGVPVLVTEHNARVFGPSVNEIGDVDPIPKMIFSCFQVEEFQKAISAFPGKQLVLAGLESHICVCQTAFDAIAEGWQVHVVEEACSSRTTENHQVGLRKMERVGVFPATVETVLFEWMEQAGTDEFRKILPLIKS